MVKLKVILDENKYIVNFAEIGELPESLEFELSNFNYLYYNCYRLVNGVLEWDENRYQEKINPSPTPNQPSEIEILQEQINTLEGEKERLSQTLEMLMVDVLPSLIP